jgi:hypothetical protein
MHAGRDKIGWYVEGWPISEGSRFAQALAIVSSPGGGSPLLRCCLDSHNAERINLASTSRPGNIARIGCPLRSNRNLLSENHAEGQEADTS